MSAWNSCQVFMAVCASLGHFTSSMCPIVAQPQNKLLIDHDDNDTNHDNGQGSFPITHRLQTHQSTNSKHTDTKNNLG